MRRLWHPLSLLFLVGLLFASPVRAQINPDDVDPESLDQLTKALQFIGEEYADRYVQPVTDAFGGGMHAGLFRTAEVGDGFVPGLPFNVYLGVSTSGTLMASSDKRFNPPTPETVSQNGRTFHIRVQGAETVPTAFGSTETPDGRLLVTAESNGQEVPVVSTELPPGLADTPVAPLLIPQAGIGSLLGTDVQLRYLPSTRLYKYGTVSVFGLAVRHSLTQYIPLSPLSVSVQGSWNEFSLGVEPPEGVNPAEVGDVVDASGWAVNLQASKSLPVLPVTFYGGLQYEKFEVGYSYLFEPTAQGTLPGGPVQIDINQTASNQVRGIAGVSLSLAVIRFNLDYALSANDTVTFGLGLRL